MRMVLSKKAYMVALRNDKSEKKDEDEYGID